MVALVVFLVLLSAAARAAWDDGIDRSFNPPSVDGLALIGTIAASPYRLGVEIMVSCKAGALIALDDTDGLLTPTYFPLAGSATDGAQGTEWFDYGHHSGRIRIFSANSSCQVSAREW